MTPSAPRFSCVFVAVLAAVALVVGGCGGSSKKTSTTAATSDQQAAGGPLVGDPTLIAGEQSCEQSHPNDPWFPTIAAFEVSDSARAHLYGCAHFLGSTTASNRVLAYKSTGVYQTPDNIVTEGPDQLFIYGGVYGDTQARLGRSWRASSLGRITSKRR